MNETEPANEGLRASAAELLVSCAIISANVMSIVALSRCVKMDGCIKMMIKNIALADTLLGSTPMVFVIAEMFDLFKILPWCYFNLIYNRVIVLMKMFSVSMLALDRFSCLYFSTWYLKYVDATLTFRVSLISWAAALGISLATFAGRLRFRAECFYENQSIGFGLILFLSLLCGITITVSYLGVFVNIRKHENHMKMLNLSSGSSRRTLYRSTMILCLLMLVFVVCFTPSGLYRTEIYLNPELRFEERESFRSVANLTFLMSSVINPALYIWRYAECRLIMLQIICRCNSKKMADLQRRQRDIYVFYLETETTT